MTDKSNDPYKAHCLRCGHTWIKKNPDKTPLACPNCNSRIWMKPKTEKPREA